ncbi:MAG: GTPase HflX [Lachnospiraceae bacterium]|nr:GTPase HflX [Lachnospiraceae bacterium]
MADVEEITNVILVGLELDSSEDFDHSMEEMLNLIEACNMEIVDVIRQKLPHPEAGTYLGRGKVEELKAAVIETGATYCIFEDNLSPAQLKNLQNIVGCEIWDRTTLILEIFSRRAKTREARLQVESAYLQYMLPRLSGMWQHLGRQGGGGGSRANKGVGETQLELDRRQINQRIAELRRELDVISRTRSVQRQGRKRGTLPSVALVGYTNAGKSTIMNKMLAMSGGEEEKKVFQKDMLFATLDTSIRRIHTESNKDFLLSDTVGFIENLPHSLIKAFRSTLEEAAQADLILVVLDVSDPYYRQHKKVTEDTLKELEADTIPRIYVMNKADMVPDVAETIPKIKGDEIWISAEEEIGMQELVDLILSSVYSGNQTLDLLVPFQRGDLMNLLHNQAHILSEEYVAEGTKVTVECPERLLGEVSDYVLGGLPEPEEELEEWEK